jgi:23S rRNA (cytosine1962-C5)-methyltransferase
VPERYHENFVIYDKDLCKHWKNGFFCDKIDRKSVLWTHTSQTVTGKREREKVEFMSLAVVTLKKGEGRFLKSGGLWVYDNEIASIMGSFVNGDIVLVRDFDGYPMGRGFINTNSKITVRMLTRDERTEISPEFLKQRVRDAWEYRKKVVDTGSCRVIFGEADFLPGLVVDKFSDVLVVQSLALGIDRLKEMIIDALKEVLAEDGIRIRGVYERSDAKVRRQEGMELTKGFIGEEFPTLVQIEENGVKYEVDIRDGQKTGFFLDQKYNRLAIQKLCKGAKVLDCFTHTGSFALNAGIAGAQSVLGVDASETAVLQARRNASLNGLDGTVKFLCEDVFELLPELEEKGEKFDVVVLDPPAFTKSRSSVKNAIKGYREINLRAMRLVKDGGFLATCSCSHFMTYELFTQTIGQAAKNVHKRLRQVEYRTQAPDHPILWSADESYYLKFYIFQVCNDR